MTMVKTPDVPMAINTPYATVAVYGHEHVAKRDLEILGLVLNSTDKDTGVRSVLFRDDGRPKGQLMSCCPDTMSVAINLEKLIGGALEYTIEHPEHSAFGKCYLDLLFCYLHEIAHLYPRVTEDLDDVEQGEEEAAANQWAEEQLMTLAKNHNLEPPLITECKFVYKKFLEILEAFVTENSSKEDKQWAESQQEMLANRTFYDLPEGESDGLRHKGLKLHNFRAYVALSFGQDVDDAEWSKPVEEAPQTVSDAISSGPEENSQPQPPETAPAVGTENNEVYMADYGDYDDYCDYAYGYDDDMGMSQNPPQSPPQSWPQQNNFYQQSEPTPPPQEPRMVYPQTGLTEQQTGLVVKGVYAKIYNHVFGNCQWQLNNDVGFVRPETVAEIPIQLTPQEAAVVVKCDCLDGNGRWCPQTPTSNGQLRGYIARNTKLPMYKLFINDGGMELCRLILPQNPAKRQGQGGPYTKTALQARGGSAIMYIMEGNDAIAAQTGKKYIAKIIDGQLMAC